MNSYSSYKDSGVEWNGEIPSHWDFVRLKYLFSLEGGKDSKSIQLEDGQYPILGTGGEISRGSDFLYDKPTLLLGRKGTIDKPFLYNEPFWVSDVMYYTIQKKDVTPKYLYLLFTLIPFDYYRYGSTQPSMSRLDYESMYFPVPPLQERQKVIKYLDTKTQKIDDLIEKTEKKIELLKEKRTSLINHCVTKGLNPNVEMKYSGVEWIGEIPSHYDIVRLKFLCSVKTGSRDTQDKVDDGDYPFYVRSPNIERINSYSFDGESVLTVGDGVGTGKVFHYVNGKFEFHQRVYKFSDFKRITGKFFYWFMKHHFIFVTEDQNSKSTVDSLRRPLIDGFQFVIPSKEEQTQIVEYLDEQTQKIDFTIEKETQRTELLKEYRQSLISEVVTGKVDVRDYNG